MEDLNGSLRAQVQELLTEVAVLKSRLEDNKVSLKLQAKEYERRLDELNHAHARAADDSRKFVTKEMHDQLYMELNSKFEKVTEVQKGVLQDLASGHGKQAMIAAVVAFVLASGTLVLALWNGLHIWGSSLR